MTIKQFIRTFLFIFAGLVLSPAQAMTVLEAGDLLLLVRPEVSGTDTIYRYVVVNNSQGKMMEFSIGVIPVEEGPPQAGDNSYGTLTRLPTGTTWGMAPAMSLEYPDMPDPREGYEIPIASSGIVTVPATPAGWRAEIDGIRLPGVELAAVDAEYSITWYAPKPVYGGPVNVTGADAGQRLGGFSVRVPQDSLTGPGAVGSAANYTQGQFEATLWFGTSWINTTEEKRRGQIILTPSALVSFSSDLPGSETNGLYTINTTSATPVATITANIVPLGVGVEPTMKLESIICYGECSPTGTYNPTAGISGAAFGTDDRTFRLEGYVANDNLVHSRYFMVTYLATSVHGTSRIYSGILLTRLPPPAETIPPTVSITAPASGSNILVGSTVTVSATASDNVAIAGVQFTLNGVALGAEVTTAPYSISWNTTGLQEGMAVLSAIARDTSGNVATASPVAAILLTCPGCNLPAGKVGTAYPVTTLRSGVWISRAVLKTGSYPPGLSAYRADYDGSSYRSLKFGGTSTAAGIYNFGLEVWLSPIGGGGITYWYPTYQVEIKP